MIPTMINMNPIRPITGE